MSVTLVVIIIVLCIILFHAICGLYAKNTNVFCKSKKRLDGKTTLVTGGTTGMGFEIALDFAERGARVIIACPFKDEGLKARNMIIETTKNDNIVFKLLDLASLAFVRNFAADILKTEDRLDILVNNAGIGHENDSLTADGLLVIMQVNYFGHFLLTILLLPLLTKTGVLGEPSRILNTSSVLHRYGKIDIPNLNRPQKNSILYNFIKVHVLQSYSNSKLCLILFSKELTERLKGRHVVVNCLDPGAVGTKIFYCQGFLRGLIIFNLFYYLSKNAYEGAQTALHVALDAKAGEVSGELFKDCAISKVKSTPVDDKTVKRLWEESARLVKLSDAEIYNCIKVD